MQEADRLSAEIEDTQEDIQILEELECTINEGNKPQISAETAEHLLTIPVPTALYWLSQEKPRLETKLNDLKKEFKNL